MPPTVSSALAAAQPAWLQRNSSLGLSRWIWNCLSRFRHSIRSRSPRRSAVERIGPYGGFSRDGLRGATIPASREGSCKMGQDNKCQREGCEQDGKPRSFVDHQQNCKWTYYLCDPCDQELSDSERIALARAKGSETEIKPLVPSN